MFSKRILFATMPMDGHLKPLTGLAVHLQSQGYEVRWYSGPSYAPTIQKLSIPYYSFRQAQEINQFNLEQVFPERQRIKGTVARLRFDMKNIFLLRIPEFIADLKSIQEEFPFDLVICDVFFMASPFIKSVLKVPVIAVGVAPLGETAANLPPAGMGLEPSSAFWGRRKQDFLRYVTTNILFKPCTNLFNTFAKQYGLGITDRLFFDTLVRRVDIYWQSGVPGFEYPRDALSPTVQFVGPLLPHQAGDQRPFCPVIKLNRYQRIILVTQGTVERDPEKLLVPTLEAFRNDPNTLVIATTGGTGTTALRTRFPGKNLLIEDYIDFQEVMPLAHVFVTNAGYGGVLMAAQNGLPMVAAGVHEGKSEIAARINYFRLGISLKTETPTSAQIRESVKKVLTDPSYRRNVKRLSDEFKTYHPHQLCQASVEKLLA
ncbi:glycosyltransferase [Spirosoma sp. HMF3257]|uniref:Glycosyltransferase n=1 Tax=Spirosoma telluris TaxID=2183553 RepID=A0A327NU90_9BACT|nr:glycosyltransferase [Spirosoma telluris]RAI78009.1 glycosyltransferase [Spirosoma telluris]